MSGFVYSLVKIVLQCKVLRYKHGLSVLFYHMEVISGVYTSLKQDPMCKVNASRLPIYVQEIVTNVFAAYLKNSVTKVVEPLSVIAWRVGACFVAGILA